MNKTNRKRLIKISAYITVGILILTGTYTFIKFGYNVGHIMILFNIIYIMFSCWVMNILIGESEEEQLLKESEGE